MSETKLKPPSGSNDSGSDNYRKNGEGPHGQSSEPFEAARLGIWLAVGSLAMLFGALIMLYMVRQQERLNYIFHAPTSLFASTLILLLSSYTCVRAIRAIRSGEQTEFVRFVGATFLLGVLFLCAQLFGWIQLARSGIYSPKNPFSVLFYVITIVHALHLIAGLIWVAIVYRNAKNGVFTAKKHLAPDLMSVYWHFLDMTWVVIFLMLWFF